MSVYRPHVYGQHHVFITCIMCDMSMSVIFLAQKLCMLCMFTNLFIGYHKNILCHRRLVHAIETGQRSMCCQMNVICCWLSIFHKTVQ